MPELFVRSALPDLLKSQPLKLGYDVTRLQDRRFRHGSTDVHGAGYQSSMPRIFVVPGTESVSRNLKINVLFGPVVSSWNDA